ncbi:MAG TPA: tripartite tricarboxylate transporter substrate binding protein [Ramlibacter sp.]|nr:tripartite tricarboxylate transporter substrate binding protein [Ramlibacter sp.]
MLKDGHGRRRLLQALAAGGAAALPTVSLAQADPAAGFPGRPLRLVVPYPPAGAVDAVARIVAQKMGEGLGQPVVIDNRPGGNAVIGTQFVAKSPADGYTMLLTASTHVINAVIMNKLPYDSFKDFAPVASLIKSDFVLAVGPSVQAANLRELIAYARANPGKLNYASSGIGNSNHLAAELFAMLTGTKLHHVPYKGSSQAMTDILGGRVQLFFSVPPNVLAQAAKGQVRLLASTTTDPMPGVGRVPTFAEAGLPGFELSSWQGILVPAGTPRPLIDRLAAECARVMALPEVRERFAGQGQQPFFNGPDALAAMIKTDTALYTRVAQAANIRVEE